MQAVARDEGVLETEAADALELLAGVLPDLAGCGKPADAVCGGGMARRGL